MTRAELDITNAIIDAIARHKLTEGESLRAVQAAAGEYVSRVAKYMIREERHPGEPNKPGGFE